MASLWTRLKKKPKQEVLAESLINLVIDKFNYKLNSKSGSHREFNHPQKDIPPIHFCVSKNKVKAIYVEKVVITLLEVEERLQRREESEKD